ncbi:MAG: hypothetical protein QNK37_22450 [Acidobacteriota bacterium]|nr:hypothetical protein [Acidobacteriota bacterium]
MDLKTVSIDPKDWSQLADMSFGTEGEPVYALMVTGKDDARAELARRGVVCFLAQDYPNRYLVIVNHGTYRFQAEGVPEDRIIQVQINERPSLGEMRNLTLKAVPEGAVCVQWDDDDWRSPGLIRRQLDAMMQSGAEAAFPAFQIKYAFATDAGWVDYHPGGFAGSIMFRKHKDMVYRSLEVHEDSFFCRGVKTMVKWVTWENQPHDVLRFIHGANVSGSAHFEQEEHPPGERDMPDYCAAYLEEIVKLYP